MDSGEVLLDTLSLGLCCVIGIPCVGCVVGVISVVHKLGLRLSSLWSVLRGFSSMWSVSQWFVGLVVPFLFLLYVCPLIIGFVDLCYRSCVGLCLLRRMIGILGL